MVYIGRELWCAVPIPFGRPTESHKLKRAQLYIGAFLRMLSPYSSGILLTYMAYSQSLQKEGERHLLLLWLSTCWRGASDQFRTCKKKTYLWKSACNTPDKHIKRICMRSYCARGNHLNSSTRCLDVEAVSSSESTKSMTPKTRTQGQPPMTELAGLVFLAASNLPCESREKSQRVMDMPH